MDQSNSASAKNLLILAGYGSSGENNPDDFDSLALALSSHLNVEVYTAFLEAAPSVGESIQMAASTRQSCYGIVLPLFVGATSAKNANVQMIVDAANERGFDMVVHYGKPLSMHSGLIATYHQRLVAALQSSTAAISHDETALLVIGRGSRDPASNAEVYQMARLLYEKVQWGAVDVAFYRTAKPNIAAGIQRCIQTGARRIVILPYLLYDRHAETAVEIQIRQQQMLYPDVEMLITSPLADDIGIIQAVSQRYQEACAELTSQLSSDGRYVPRPHMHGSHAHPVTPSVADLQPLLPPRYLEDRPVSAAPMGAADLIFDVQGKVAWDQIWGDFCDLALAGGPPHRGTLLEPVAPESIPAHLEQYEWVLTELERGIGMITHLTVVRSAAPGWVGVQCVDEAMALWLLRAIVVENVSVRREGNVLYFPAGPHFRLEHEIKNIITVIAKTHHYWTEHLTSQAKN